MDRKGQLGNVAFGGDWSEAIEERERIAAAMAVLDRAAAEAGDVDARHAEVDAALRELTAKIAKGTMLADAWHRAAAKAAPAERETELRRLARTIRQGLGHGLGP